MANKMKKMMALILVMIMCLGSFSLPVYAYDSGDSDEGKVTFPISKTATGLDQDDQTDVTLTVPGTVEGAIDVVFILGGGMTANMETIESAINVFKPAMESGKATVRMGLISLEKGKEIILDLNSDEAVLDPDTYVDFVTEKFDSINDLPYGTTNLHSQLLEAERMLAAETKADAENKYVFVLATGRTYWFDDANGEQATIVNNLNGTYYWGNYLWQSQRGGNSSLYMIPARYNNSYEAFLADVEKWIAEDGDKYVFTPHFDKNDYSAYVNWESKNNKDLRALGISGSRYGNGIVNPKPTDANFITGTAAGASSGGNPSDALNYERAQYESIQVWKELVGKGYNCYSLCSESPNYQNGSKNIKSKGYTGTSTLQVGHAFMDYLATLAGHDKAPVVWDYQYDENGKVVFYPGKEGNYNYAYTALKENFFDEVRDDMLYTTSVGSTVEDYIGYDEATGNFEFITDPETITLIVGNEEYETAQIETKDGATASYAFTAKDAEEATFWVDYYYGDGKTTEKFIWTFGENVSMERLASLTYKLQLTEKAEEAGTYIVPTNNSATLYPVDSDGEEGNPQVFPIPTVEYSVVPYDVDIVLALGAGIAQYDANGTKGTNTYDSIVSLVEPLVNQGINVKLGLVAVEHYDDVAMPLTELTKDNYKTVITEGLDKIQSMPAGPTNLHGNIVAAKEMLDADTSVPAENKFFHVIATGRTYNYDNEDGIPTTIVNKIALKGNTYYYWGHYLWQSQRGGHTSLYMIPARYNNDFEAYWADVCAWVEADGDTYAYSFDEAYDVTDPQWFNTFYRANNKDAKALGLASSRFGWVLGDLTNSGLAAIGSGSNPQNALNYERAQYEAYYAFQEMKEAGYNCYALCSESTSYQNGSPYIKIAKYTGTSTIQLGHSFMNFLNGGEAPLLFVMTDPNTGASEMAKNFFEPVVVEKLTKTEKAVEQEESIPMFSAGPSFVQKLEIVEQPEDVYGAIGETLTTAVFAEGEDLQYQWYYRDAKDEEFTKSIYTGNEYTIILKKSRLGRQVYCDITDANGNTVTTEIATFYGEPNVKLEITEQPSDVTGALGETLSSYVSAQGEDLKYQWYYRDAGKTKYTKSSLTGADYTIIMKESRLGREVYCVITDAYGNKVTTETATFYGEPNVALEITAQPSDVTGALGETLSSYVSAQGEGLKYQWYYRDAGKTKYTKSSLTGSDYTIIMKAGRDGREVYCVITDAYGNSVKTETAKFIVE